MANNPRNLRPSLINIDDIIHFYALKSNIENKTVRCIQIGANDGKVNDPIYKYVTEFKWNSVHVEPQTWVYENELKNNYKDYPNAKLVNAAMADSNIELPFYQLSFTNQRWATGLAGFDKSSLLNQIERGYVDRKAKKNGVKTPENKEDYIAESKVNTTTFDQLAKQHNFEDVDFLCIDTEGFDYEVLKLFNFEKYHPEIILFESKNLKDNDYIESKKLLEGNGYQLYWQKGDTVAIRFSYPFINKVKSKITAFFSKL